MKIMVHNWFNTTDISVYQANRATDGNWTFSKSPCVTIKGNDKAEIIVANAGIYLTWWATVWDEKPFGYLPVHEGLEVLDVFDIAAGNMPRGYYASWRGPHK